MTFENHKKKKTAYKRYFRFLFSAKANYNKSYNVEFINNEFN